MQAGYGLVAVLLVASIGNGKRDEEGK